MGWKVNWWARLLDGNRAYKLIKDQLSPIKKEGGGTYPNLFDAHPPFQIDGNFGCSAGIAEMLVQSHDEALHILPALPDAWHNGSISGLRARGGFEIVQLEWKEGKVAKLIIKSNLGGNCRVRLPNELILKGLKRVDTEGGNPNSFYQIEKTIEPIVVDKEAVKKVAILKTVLYDFETIAGKTYVLRAK